MARAALPQRGPGRGTRRSRVKVSRKKLQPLQSSSILRRGDVRSCRGASAAKLVAGRAIALLVCNGRGCHRSQACRRRSMHLCMIFTCYMILHRHVSTRASQAWRCAAAGHRSSWAWVQSIWPRGSPRRATGCNLFRDAAAWEARERARPNRPLSSRVSTAVREVVFLVSQGTLGLSVGGPIDLVWSVRVLWAVLWRQGARGRA